MRLWIFLILLLIVTYNSISDKNELRLTGEASITFKGRVEELMKNYNIPGGIIGISKKDDRQILSFGIIDKENSFPTQTFSKFRIASISKPITAVGVLLLIEKK